MITRILAMLCAGASLALPASALADYGPDGGVYGGKAKTKGGALPNRIHPVSVKLTKNGKEIKLLRLTAAATCSPSGSANTSPAWEDVKLARNGNFSDRDKFSVRGDDGSETTWRSTLEGQLGPRGGSGKARDKATVRDSDGNVVRTCDTGVVRFDLKRSERVYAGGVKLARAFRSFGPVYPVSLERSRGGGELANFRIRYIARCGDAGQFHTNSFQHSNIEVKRNGEFSRSRKFRYKSTTGTVYKGTYTLRGQLGENRGSGTYRVKFNATLATGEKLPCDTGKRKWSVAQR